MLNFKTILESIRTISGSSSLQGSGLFFQKHHPTSSVAISIQYICLSSIKIMVYGPHASSVIQCQMKVHFTHTSNTSQVLCISTPQNYGVHPTSIKISIKSKGFEILSKDFHSTSITLGNRYPGFHYICTFAAQPASV